MYNVAMVTSVVQVPCRNNGSEGTDGIHEENIKAGPIQNVKCVL